MTDRPIVIVHVSESGEPDFRFSGEVDFYVVDESSPHDRVYQMTIADDRASLIDILGNDAIGSASDERHAALSNRILGKPILRVVPSDGGEP